MPTLDSHFNPVIAALHHKAPRTMLELVLIPSFSNKWVTELIRCSINV